MSPGTASPCKLKARVGSPGKVSKSRRLKNDTSHLLSATAPSPKHTNVHCLTTALVSEAETKTPVCVCVSVVYVSPPLRLKNPVMHSGSTARCLQAGRSVSEVQVHLPIISFGLDEMIAHVYFSPAQATDTSFSFFFQVTLFIDGREMRRIWTNRIQCYKCFRNKWPSLPQRRGSYKCREFLTTYCFTWVSFLWNNYWRHQDLVTK